MTYFAFCVSSLQIVMALSFVLGLSLHCLPKVNFPKFQPFTKQISPFLPCHSIGPKIFRAVQIILVWVQIILVTFRLYFSGLIFIIRTCSKWFGRK